MHAFLGRIHLYHKNSLSANCSVETKIRFEDYKLPHAFIMCSSSCSKYTTLNLIDHDINP